MPVVVAALYGKRAKGRSSRIDGDNPVLRIVGVGERAVASHVAVGVVCNLAQRRRGAENERVLVEAVRRVGVRGDVRRRPEAVAVGNARAINRHSPAPYGTQLESGRWFSHAAEIISYITCHLQRQKTQKN